MHYLQDAHFPPFIERRRSLYEILPSEPDNPIPASRHWTKLVSSLVVALTVTGAQTYHAHSRGSDSKKAHSQGIASYRWSGFHRVAP